jgi:hypothetical protein
VGAVDEREGTAACLLPLVPARCGCGEASYVGDRGPRPLPARLPLTASCSGFARELIKDLEAVRPSVITDIVASAEGWQVAEADGGGVGGDDDDDDGCGDARGSSGGGGGHGRAASDAASVRSGGTAASSSSTASASGGLTTRARVQSSCARCGYMTSAGSAGLGAMARRVLCQACTLLAGLEAGTPRVGLGDGRPGRRGVAGTVPAAAAATGVDGGSIGGGSGEALLSAAER